MDQFRLSLPRLYGDHHVIEVRRLLLDLPGVRDVYASSSFHLLEVDYDPELTGEEKIREVLDRAGYLGKMEIAVERGPQAAVEGGIFYRRAETFELAGRAIGFVQQIPDHSRALWPCPGMGAQKADKGEG